MLVDLALVVDLALLVDLAVNLVMDSLVADPVETNIAG